MNFEKLKKFIKKEEIPAFRVGQIRKAVFEQGITSWEQATSLPENLRTLLQEKFRLLSFEPKKVLESKKSPAYKAVLKLHDGILIESVLMCSMKNHWSVCVSTQAGCPVGCSFCATGKMGFKRNLSEEEIADQVLFWYGFAREKKLADRISSVVFMGMGEPLLNYTATVNAVKDLNNPDYLNIGQRHISVSTCGFVPKILSLAKDLPQVNLAVSIHTAIDEERDGIVPLNRKHNLTELGVTLNKYVGLTGRQLFIEYTVLRGVNDLKRHSRRLAEWVRAFDKPYLVNINLIALNARKETSEEENENVKRFSADLQSFGLNVTIRKSLGSDILAACGQLVAR